MKKWKIVLAVVLFLLVLPVAAGAIYVNFVLDKVIVDENGFDKNFDLMTNENLKDSEIKNIALFGVDCRTTDYKGCRSDVMMVLSYNMDSNKVTVTSLVRDTYVEIENRGLDKLNHAYAFGGPELAIQTINRTIDLDIEDYITVDFWAVEKIIDCLGGVEIDVNVNEFPLVNGYLWEQNEHSPDGIQVKEITRTGLQTLNGRQAVAYMRIRYVGDGDFERMQRQREVMEAALSKLESISLTSLMGMVNDLLSTIKTNLTKEEIIDLITKVVTKGVPAMEQYQFPARDGGIGKTIDGIYYFVPNTLIENVKKYHELIYSNTDYTSSDYIEDLSDRLENFLYY